MVWVGTCYLLIQIFGHFILSKCTSSTTAPSVSCETTKLLDAWLFTGGTLYLPPRERPPNDLCLVLGDSIWVASLKPPPAKIVRSVDVCRLSGKDDVSVVYFRMGYGFLFGRQGDDPTFNHSPDWLETLVHLFLVPCLIEVSYLSVSMRLKASPACRRDLIKLSAKSPNIAACWA